MKCSIVCPYLKNETINQTTEQIIYIIKQILFKIARVISDVFENGASCVLTLWTSPSSCSICCMCGFPENLLSQDMISFHNRNTLRLSHYQHGEILLISRDHTNGTMTLVYPLSSFACLIHSNCNAPVFQPWKTPPCTNYLNFQVDVCTLHHYSHIS